MSTTSSDYCVRSVSRIGFSGSQESIVSEHLSCLAVERATARGPHRRPAHRRAGLAVLAVVEVALPRGVGFLEALSLPRRIRDRIRSYLSLAFPDDNMEAPDPVS